MKIAIVSFLIDPHLGGGAATSAARMADGLESRGHEVVVITTGPKNGIEEDPETGRRTYRISPANLYWVAEKHRQPLAKRALWQLIDVWNPHVFHTMKRLLAKERPDVVHVQKLRGLSPAAWSAAAAVNVKAIIHTCRDYELMSPEGTLNGIVGSWALEGRWPIAPYQRIRRYVSRHVDVATAPSRFTLEAHVERGFFRRSAKRVIPNSHGKSVSWLRSKQDDCLRHEAQAIDPDHGLRILYIGRIEASKGVDDLFEAFVSCARTYPDIHLDVAGWGKLEERIKREYGAHSRIQFHGAVFGANKEKVFENADVVVVPSRWPEVFGNVIVEAFARGKPVVATTVGGISELVEPGRTGLLVSSGSVRELAGALSWCADNRPVLRSMKAACFNAAERFSLDVVTESYEKAYIAAIESQGRFRKSQV